MTELEYLELLTLTSVLLPNMDPREFDVKAAARRQMELYKKATYKYSLYQEVNTED